jgi:hypothetical protein
MTDKKYNGWTNYETWRVNLEVFDGLELSDVTYRADNSDADTYEVSNFCKEYADEVVLHGSSGLVHDYASAFLSEVNFYEIAEHMVQAYNEENEEDESDDD